MKTRQVCREKESLESRVVILREVAASHLRSRCVVEGTLQAKSTAPDVLIERVVAARNSSGGNEDIAICTDPSSRRMTAQTCSMISTPKYEGRNSGIASGP